MCVLGTRNVVSMCVCVWGGGEFLYKNSGAARRDPRGVLFGYSKGEFRGRPYCIQKLFGKFTHIKLFLCPFKNWWRIHVWNILLLGKIYFCFNNDTYNLAVQLVFCTFKIINPILTHKSHIISNWKVMTFWGVATWSSYPICE